jgi:hypothetical protein
VVDFHVQDGAKKVSLLFLGIKAADLSETEQWCAKVDIL